MGRNRRSAAGAVPPDVMPSDGRETRARRENGKEGLEGREGSIHPSMACMLVCGGRAGPIAHRAEASREEEETREENEGRKGEHATNVEAQQVHLELCFTYRKKLKRREPVRQLRVETSTHPPKSCG